MTDYVDADDYTEEVTEDELEEARSAAEAIIAAEFDSQYARQAWDNSQESPLDDGFLFLS